MCSATAAVVPTALLARSSRRIAKPDATRLTSRFNDRLELFLGERRSGESCSYVRPIRHGCHPVELLRAERHQRIDTGRATARQCAALGARRPDGRARCGRRGWHGRLWRLPTAARDRRAPGDGRARRAGGRRDGAWSADIAGRRSAGPASSEQWRSDSSRRCSSTALKRPTLPRLRPRRAVLIVATGAASFFPAWRASGIDPAEILKAE